MSAPEDESDRGSFFAVRPCSRVRSTLLAGSVKALRDHGHGARYQERVPVEYHELLLMTGAPRWFPLNVAEAHYAACDALSLGTDEVLRIGAAVAPVHASGVSVVLRAARASGATPWAILHNAERYWSRMYDGSTITVTEKGPKDSVIQIIGQPLARSRYWRTGLRGIILGLAGGLSQKAHAREMPLRGPDEVSYSLAWV